MSSLLVCGECHPGFLVTLVCPRRDRVTRGTSGSVRRASSRCTGGRCWLLAPWRWAGSPASAREEAGGGMQGVWWALRAHALIFRADPLHCDDLASVSPTKITELL